MMNIVLEIENLHIGYKHGKDFHSIHKDINLKAIEGEVVTLIGPNGIGKSTLLKTMTHFLKPLAGKVHLYGKNLEKFSRKELSKKVSFVSTDLVTVNNLTAYELVSLGRHPYTNWLGTNAKADHDAVFKALSDVRAGHLSDKFISEISDGERQRIVVARALAQDTPIIILDEPTAFLDLPNKYEIFHLLVELSRKELKTIVLSSHDLNIALTEVDKVWLMSRNQIMEGAPEDLILHNQLNPFMGTGNVFFDNVDGTFKVNRVFANQIQVVGEGLTLHWTMKAMERLGYEINENADWSVHCEKGDKLSWTLKKKESRESFDFNSIYDLNLHIKSKTKRNDNRI
jgi:iron complex transport system ATP-binding protein